MTKISIPDAVWAGFRLVRREWRAVLVWGGVYLIASLVNYDVLVAQWAALANSAASPEQMAKLEDAAFGWNLLSLALSEVATVLILSAVMRAVLRPEERRFFYLRFGARELWVGIAGPLGCLLVILPLLPAAVLGLVTLHTPPESPVRDWLTPAGWALAVAGLVTAVWLALRLAPLMPMAFEQKRFPLKEAWRISRGHVWRILQLCIAVAAIVVAITGGLMFVLTLIGLAAGIPLWALLGTAIGTVATQAVAVAALVMTVLGAVYTAAVYAVSYGAWMEFYRQLTKPAETAA